MEVDLAARQLYFWAEQLANTSKEETIFKQKGGKKIEWVWSLFSKQNKERELNEQEENPKTNLNQSLTSRHFNLD